MRHSRAIMRGSRGRGPASCYLGAVVLTGCASSVAIRVPQAGPDTACVTPAPERDVLVGVALSGGGSRAALFGAAGLEALGRLPAPGGGSVLEQVTYLSSVSGGSVAATYYASQKPPRETPVLTPEGAMTDEYQAFFAEYRDNWPRTSRAPCSGANCCPSAGSTRRWRPAPSPRSWPSACWAQATFADLSPAGGARRQPRLIVNTTLYNSGRRSALTTLPPEASRYDFYADLRASMARRELTAEFPPAFLQRWGKLLTLTPMELGIDLCPIRLAGAVAASASFPPLVGPITFHVGDEDLYWHMGDGGLYENQGFESLLFVFLKKLQEQTARRALILLFDSSFPFAVGERRLSRRAQPFSLWNYDYTRIPSIMEQRASTYQALLFRSLQLEGVFPDDQTIRVVQLRHTDAQWQPDLSDLPEACRRVDPPFGSTAAVAEHLAEISTRFWLASPCDRQLLQVAAAKVVAQHRAEIATFLQGPVAAKAGR